MIATLQDELENVRAGYDMEDSNHYIIKFKGDDKIVYSHDLERPLTATQIKKSNTYPQMADCQIIVIGRRMMMQKRT